MTELLYQIDSYMKEFQAKIVKIFSNENAVVLNRTAFYPVGGGQPSDTGTIEVAHETFIVTKVKKQNGYVLHFIEGKLPEQGLAVIGKIDWNRRYEFMRTHTALHILSAVVWRDYKAQVTGGNMESLKGRLDFEFENINAELVKKIEVKINEEVKNARDIKVKFLTREKADKIPDLIRTKINLLPKNLTEIRIVEIEGLDIQADGGTHVRNTKEVGKIYIDGYKSKGRINKRIKISLKK